MLIYYASSENTLACTVPKHFPVVIYKRVRFTHSFICHYKQAVVDSAKQFHYVMFVVATFPLKTFKCQSIY